MDIREMDKYIGAVNNAEISANYTFDALSSDIAFIRRELVLTLENGAHITLADTTQYFEFRNSNVGRSNLEKSGIDQKIIDVVKSLWGPTPTMADPKEE